MMSIDEVIALTDSAISELSYEQSRDLLQLVVESLDDSDLPLSQLMKLWEVGEKISSVCGAHLEAAATKLNDGLPTDNS